MKRRLTAKDVESLENTSIGGSLGVLDVGVVDAVVTPNVCAAGPGPVGPIWDEVTACICRYSCGYRSYA